MMATVTKVETVTRVVMELSHAEAQTLAEIFGRIGGKASSARVYVDSMLGALEGAGYRYREPGGAMFSDGMAALYFADGSKALVEAPR